MIVQGKLDNALIQSALKGNKEGLETLIKRHQDWVFNIALTFVGDRTEAADLSQEVWIKVITKLSTYREKSAFRTWLYRIVKNHFLNMQRAKFEDKSPTFEAFGKALDATPNEVWHNNSEVEDKLVVEEAKISCMKGMLLCLDREQRMIYILGELFEFSDTIGAEIMEISRENFRVKLHRCKTQLYNFMDNKCGLINKANPCRCARKTAAFVKVGCVDAETLQFQRDAVSRITDQIPKKVMSYSNEVVNSYQALFQEHPFLESPEALEGIKKLLTSKEVQETFNFE